MPRPHPAFRRSRHAALLAATVLVAVHVSSETRITEDNVALLYESRAAVPAPDHRLAAMISIDYHRAQDEFTRHDLFQKIEPVIRQRLGEAEATDHVLLLVLNELSEYDFERSAFPTGFGANTYFDFQAGHGYSLATKYRVRFANGDDLAHVPVPVDDARRLSSRLRRDRDAAYRIEGVPGRAVEERGRKTLYVTVTRVEMSLPNGPTVAVVDLAAPAPTIE